MIKKLKDNVVKWILMAKYQLIRLWAAIYIVLASGSYVYASGFKGSIYETGTKKMAKDLLSVGQGVIAVAVLALWIFWEIQKRMGEENEEGRFSKKQKGAIVGLIIAETISTLFGIIGGYYGISIS